MKRVLDIKVLMRGLAWVAILLAVPVCACIERVDGELAVSDIVASADVWEFRGSFGGLAEIETHSDDPWEIRFEEGKFRQIAGVTATEDEVWVCDLAVSRIQIFDFDGEYQRSFGCGVSINDTLLTDRELYIENRDFPRRHTEGTLRWEDDEGLRWTQNPVTLFKASDILVVDEGIIMADQARTSAENQPLRNARVVLLRRDGSYYEVSSGRQFWPAYLAMSGSIIAMAEVPGNALWLGEITDQEWPFKVLTAEVEYRNYLSVLIDHAEDENFLIHERLVTKSGSNQNQYYGLGGIAVAFDKLIACDRGNKRLQVMEGRRENAARWGKVARIVTDMTDTGKIRFDTPLDIDVDAAGNMYILDAGRLEVAVLADNFERIGSFGRDQITVPWAIDLSDDGNHCFVTDQRTNLVHHYERSR